METSSSCSHWWHAPFYFAISITLAAMAISSLHQNLNTQPSLLPNSTSSTFHEIPHDLASNATRALRKSGFNFMATLLQISPELFLSSSQETTMFVVQDVSIANVSLPPWLMKDLFRYHTVPKKILMKELLEKEKGFCLRTLVRGKNVAITDVDKKAKLVDINGVKVIHPDIFTEGVLAVHGIMKPLVVIDPKEENPGWESIHAPVCESLDKIVTETNVNESRNGTVSVVPWTRIVRLLSSNGFVPFSIGLRSVLDGIVKDSENLNGVTIFAPRDFDYVSSPLPVLERFVKFHILPERFTYKNLAVLPEKASLRTLVNDSDLEITLGITSGEILSIEGVEITAPDVFTSDLFVVHGISKPFEMATLSTMMVH